MSDTIPTRDAPSGRFVLRLPPALHGALRIAPEEHQPITAAGEAILLLTLLKD